MNFNFDELQKIKKATSGFFKGKARKAVAESLTELKPSVELLKQLDGSEQKSKLTQLVKAATAARQNALHAGANGYGDTNWAAAAACESWLHDLANGTPESNAAVENLVLELIERGK